MPMEMYVECGGGHTAGDMEIDQKFVHNTQKKLNGHVSMWIKCLNMGEDWKHQSRLRETQINHSNNVAPVYLLVKDHKEYSGSCPPKTRAVCAANSGMDVHLSNILSPIIEAVADNMKKKDEVISTDDALSRIDSYNLKQAQSMQCRDEAEPEEMPSATTAEYTFGDVLDEVLGDNWEREQPPEPGYNTDEEEFNEDDEELDKLFEDEERQEEEIVVVGIDIVSLFPSITSEQGGKLCREAILETEITFEGVNYQEIAIYIALNYSSHYKIPADVRELIPQRPKARGQRPGVTGNAAASESPTINGGQWRFYRTKFSDAEKKLLLAEAVSIGVRAVFQNHL